MAINYHFDANYAGRNAYMPGDAGTLGEMNGGPVFRVVSISIDGEQYGDSAYPRLTGWYITKNGNNWYQSVSGYWHKWVDGSQLMTESAPQYSDSSVYAMINKLIANNKRILENNLLCAKYADKFNVEQQQMLYDLQTRLNERNTQLQNPELISSTKVSYPKGWSSWDSQLEAFMANGRVGSVTITIVVAVVVFVSLLSAAYWAYKYYYEESVNDVKYSDELTKILADKLTPEEYEKLKEETAGMITKAKLSARLSGMTSIGKYALIGLGALFLFRLVKNASDPKSVNYATAKSTTRKQLR